MPNSCPASLEQIYGVLGHPVAQSMSPMLHTWAFAQKGVRGLYTAWDTPPGELAAFMRAFRETPYDGASVTIPHKEAVIPFLDGLTATAQTIGAVNTLFWEKDRLMGHNTDMEGFLSPLSGLAAPGTALVLGAGGAARAVLAAFASLTVPRVTIAARGQAKAEKLAADFAASFAAITVCSWEDRLTTTPEDGRDFWVVNTTPLGMHGKAEGESPLPEAWFAALPPERCLAYDLVYNPLETAFLTLAKNAGWRRRDGLDMFVAQAAAQFRLWTGLGMPEPQARLLLANYLAA
ncbi:Shikimate dehydrogenase [uncultured delta proteobacterium]|uniref:Shikimate dehydrogenase (NADP(+)) n=1 Tax=uncultured delta proteobacterium TaxID=34034 RepID=A0A212JPM2_9DELT|nr:Shikimate dehydrogenase [uncultured delta proteobacterium]